jgi:hypothetical protein
MIEIAARTIDPCVELETTSGRSSVAEQMLPKLRIRSSIRTERFGA